MNRIIGVTELQRRFKSVFDEVVKEQIPYILTRGSRPEAVLIPYEEYVRYKTRTEEEVIERFDNFMKKMAEANARYSEEEVVADVEAAIREVREERQKNSGTE
jgi:prevent-host-death family protein